MQADRQSVPLAAAAGAGYGALKPAGAVGIGQTHIEAGHGDVRHDVQGRAAIDPRHVDGNPVTGAVQGVQRPRNSGGGRDGVSTLMKGASGMG